MKRGGLLRHLRARGCELLREGRRHSWWHNPSQNKRSAVPRHNEIDDNLADKKGPRHSASEMTGSDEIGVRKPHPDIFTRTLSALAVPPEAALHAGDDPIADVGGAKSVGMLAIHLRRPADATIFTLQLQDVTRLAEPLLAIPRRYAGRGKTLGVARGSHLGCINEKGCVTHGCLRDPDRPGLLGHKDVSATMIYTRVLNHGPGAVRVPADCLFPR